MATREVVVKIKGEIVYKSITSTRAPEIDLDNIEVLIVIRDDSQGNSQLIGKK